MVIATKGVGSLYMYPTKVHLAEAVPLVREKTE